MDKLQLHPSMIYPKAPACNLGKGADRVECPSLRKKKSAWMPTRSIVPLLLFAMAFITVAAISAKHPKRTGLQK